MKKLSILIAPWTISFPFIKIELMRISTRFVRLASVVTLFCVLCSDKHLQAQCTITPNGGSVSFTQSLSSSGTATINASTLTPYIGWSCSGAGGMLQFSDEPTFATPSNGSFVLDCDDLLPAPASVWVRAIDATNTPTPAVELRITLADNQAPVITCPANVMVNNASGLCSATVTYPAATVMDNCNAQTTVTYSQSSGTIFPVGNTTVTATATDEAGNSASCAFTITVTDNQPPTITCPSNITQPANAMCVAVVNYSANGLDNCQATVSYSIPPGSTFNLGTTSVTATVTDPAGQSANCMFNVTVVDQTPPVFNVSSSLTVNAQGLPSCLAQVNYVLTADSLKDNCSAFAATTIMMDVVFPPGTFANLINVPYDPASIDEFPLGTSTITFRATDSAVPANTSTQMVTITVQDVTAPVFNPLPHPPGGDTIWCGRTFNLVNVTNNCSNTFTWRRPNIFFGDADDCQSGFITEQVLTPSGANDVAIEGAINSAGYNYNSVSSPSVTAQFPVGTRIIRYTLEDDAGNVSTCNITVTVTDVQPPTVQCPPSTTLNTTCPTATLPDYRNGVNVFDNCQAAINITQSPAQGVTLASLSGIIGTPNVGDVIPVTMSVSDGSNPPATCTFNVTLDDTGAPVPNVQPLPTIRDSCGFLTLNAPTATDGCAAAATIIHGVATVIPATGVAFIPPSGSFGPRYTFMPGNYSVTWIYSDGNGNQTTQSQMVTVLPDTFPPVALCRPLITVPLQADGDTTITVGMIDNGSFDPNNCGPITRVLSKTVFTCANLDTNLVTLTVTDANGRTATCTSRVVIRDVTAPTFAGVPANITITSCDTIPAPPVVTATDACTTPVQVMYSQTSTQTASGCGRYSYTITRKWVARDNRMNADSVIRTITIIDQPPSFAMVPDSIVVLTGPNRTTCSDTVRLNYQNLVKDCIPGLRFTLSGGNFPGIYGVGTAFVTITAIDSCGNSASKIVRVVVRDGTPPRAVCTNGISTTVSPGGQAVITQLQINNNSFDNCDGLYPSSDTVHIRPVTYTFNCSDADGVTQHPVALTVVDNAGNMAVCSTYVVVQDNVRPTVTCPPNITVQCNQSVFPGQTGTATAVDNCPGNLAPLDYTDTEVPGNVAGLCRVVTRRWFTTDKAGNIGTCTQVITQRDTLAPVLSTLPPSDTIECFKDLPTVPNITATDNCDPSVSIAFVQDTLNRAPGLCGKYNYTIRRTWTATDDCGSVTTRSYQIMVRDTVRPSFPGMPDTIRVFSANFPTLPTCAIPYSFNAYPFLSECADSADLIMSNNAPFGANRLRFAGNFAPGTYKVTFNVTDPCGNSGRDSIVFVFRDNTAPTMVCQTSIDVALGTNGTGTITTADINIGTNDNCGIDTMFLSKNTFNCSNLGMNSVTLTAIDKNGNSNVCVANVNVLVGSATVFSANVSGSPTTYFGASTGSASATITSGSGTFTYAWSNNANTPTINNLPAGTYTVTITNTTSGCVLVDTAIVANGPKIKLTVGNVIAGQGQTVNVPVTVSQLINVNSFSFALNNINPSVAVVNALVNIHPTISANLIHSISGNSVNVAWVDPNGGLLNLPANSVLFNIEAIAVGAVNTITPVAVGAGSSLPFEFIQQFGSNQTVVPVDVMNGSISISSSPQNTLAGNIATWVNPDIPSSVARNVANVSVTVTGPSTQNMLTGTDGNYTFSVPSGSNTVTTPVKNTPGNVGITSADLLRIINHIFGTVMMSPYQQIAADVNNDNIISLGDYLKIQRLVLGTVQHLDSSPDWIFVPKSYTFPAPVGGSFLGTPYPRTIEHTPVLLNYLTDDFVAIRRGDVTGNGPVTLKPLQVDERYESDETLRLIADNQSLEPGTQVIVPIFAEGAEKRNALQGTFIFDTEVLEFEGVSAGKLDVKSSDFGTALVRDGQLSLAWAKHQAAVLAANDILFQLHFRSKAGNKQLNEVLDFGSAITRAESYTLDGQNTPVQLSFRGDYMHDAFSLLQSRPNPAIGSAEIGFILPEAGDATLRITNLEGRVLRTINQTWAKGYNQVTISKQELGGAGVYFYELQTNSQSARRKMVFID